MQFILHSEKETEEFGAKLASILPKKAIICLEGHLGVGKTTLVRGFIKSLGYTGTVKSPTYNIVEEYEINHHTVLHFDLYRINDPEELQWIGIEDYFKEQAICFIEWPSLGEGYLESPDLILTLENHSQGRKIEIKKISETMKKRLEC